MAKEYFFLFLIVISLIYYTHGALELKLEHMSTVYLPYNITDDGNSLLKLKSGSVEQIAYHLEDQLIYVVGDEVLHIVNCTYPEKLTRITTLNLGPYDLTDIEVCDDYLFITADDKLDRPNGKLFVFSKYSKQASDSLKLIHSINVGTIPDMLQVVGDCKTVIVAVGGEPYVDMKGSDTNPPGGVAILHFENLTVHDRSPPSFKFLGFGMFNNRIDLLKSRGVKITSNTGDSTSSTNELEPKYIAVDHKEKKAFVVLQENNAVAEVDLVSETITDIHGLGYKQWGHLDASDDGLIGISYWPIKSFYQPDGIAYYKWNGRRLAFTANEGDPSEDNGKKGQDFSDAKFGPDIPDFVISALNDSKKLGNLMFSKDDGLDSNGVYQTLYTFGGRSFSIWDVEEKFQRVYDSGSDIEEKTALYCPHVFNSDGTKVDSRSDNQGPQPECVIAGEIESRLYIFVANERPGTIIVYSIGNDVTKPRFETIFCGGIPKDNRSLQEKFKANELYMMDPEDIRFLSKVKSIEEFPYLLVSGSLSTSVSIMKLSYTSERKEGSKSGEDTWTRIRNPSLEIIKAVRLLVDRAFKLFLQVQTGVNTWSGIWKYSLDIIKGVPVHIDRAVKLFFQVKTDFVKNESSSTWSPGNTAFVGAMIAGGTAQLAGPKVLSWLGFRRDGIAPGSVATRLQALAHTHGVGKSVVAAMQSAGTSGKLGSTDLFTMVAIGWTVGFYVGLLLWIFV